jgi:hypothetical protein
MPRRRGHPGRLRKILTPICNNGYLKVNLYHQGTMQPALVHRLVAIHHIVNTDSFPEVNHLEGVKNNNEASSLEWCTGKRNIQHGFDMGLCPSGEEHYCAKLTNAQVREMRALYTQKGVKQVSLAKTFGVNYRTVSDIVNRKKWRHVE